MSYARMGNDSDIYLYAHVEGGWECCGCRLHQGSVALETLKEVADHLQEHLDFGHVIPERTFERVYSEIEIHGKDYTNPGIRQG